MNIKKYILRAIRWQRVESGTFCLQQVGMVVGAVGIRVVTRRSRRETLSVHGDSCESCLDGGGYLAVVACGSFHVIISGLDSIKKEKNI